MAIWVGNYKLDNLLLKTTPHFSFFYKVSIAISLVKDVEITWLTSFFVMKNSSSFEKNAVQCKHYRSLIFRLSWYVVIEFFFSVITASKFIILVLSTSLFYLSILVDAPIVY